MNLFEAAAGGICCAVCSFEELHALDLFVDRCVCVYMSYSTHSKTTEVISLFKVEGALSARCVVFFSMTVHRCILFDGIWLRIMYPATMVCHESRVLFSIELCVQQQRFFEGQISSQKNFTYQACHGCPSFYEDTIVTSILRFGLNLM